MPYPPKDTTSELAGLIITLFLAKLNTKQESFDYQLY